MRYSTLCWDFYESLLLAILLYPLRVFLDFLSHHFRFFHNAPYIANRTFCRGLFRDFTQTSHNKKIWDTHLFQALTGFVY